MHVTLHQILDHTRYHLDVIVNHRADHSGLEIPEDLDVGPGDRRVWGGTSEGYDAIESTLQCSHFLQGG